jgi:hypothetical protein
VAGRCNSIVSILPTAFLNIKEWLCQSMLSSPAVTGKSPTQFFYNVGYLGICHTKLNLEETLLWFFALWAQHENVELFANLISVLYDMTFTLYCTYKLHYVPQVFTTSRNPSTQCCRSGSGIRPFFDPKDPGSGMKFSRIRDSGWNHPGSATLKVPSLFNFI